MKMSTPKSMWLKVEKTRQINRKKRKTKYIGIPEKKEMVGLGGFGKKCSTSYIYFPVQLTSTNLISIKHFNMFSSSSLYGQQQKL
jgi:hypothetical protein